MTEGPKGKYPLLQQKLESSFNFFYGTFDYTGKSRRLTDAMYKFVFYFILRFFLGGGVLITGLKLSNFVNNHQFNPQSLKIV